MTSPSQRAHAQARQSSLIASTGARTSRHSPPACQVQPALQPGAPSHASPPSTTPLPQLGWQSLSFSALAFFGQQPSLSFGIVIEACVQVRLQFSALPVTTSAVHASPSSQSTSHGLTSLLGSHVSMRGSTTPSPQFAEQSESVSCS